MIKNPYVFAKDGPAGSVQNGISLRDYFAGQAILAIQPKISESDYDNYIKSCAELCYKFAEAMLEERFKRLQSKSFEGKQKEMMDK